MRISIVFVFVLGFIFSASSQDKMKTSKWRKTERDSLDHAIHLYEEGSYIAAIPIFQHILNNHPNEIFLKYMNGLCRLYRSDKHDEALVLLTEVYEKNKKIAEIELDLAKAYHLNYKFDDALYFLEQYKIKNKKLDAKKLEQLDLIINYCNNGRKFMENPLPAKIINIDEPINTEASEYVPVISSDEAVMIYTYRGDKSIGGLQNDLLQPDPFGVYMEDVYIAFKEQNGKFSAPKEIGSTINTVGNDAAVALSPDGQKLFIYKDDGSNGGDLYMSVLSGKDWSFPERLLGDINTSSWEGSCSISADGKTLYFSSERAGGYGGKDIYKSILQSDGTWGTAINLGQTINTAYDEDAPFIHPDGKIMVFSGKGKGSMGGYDIFRTVLNTTDSTWSTPENMGYPINSPDDDIYYVLTADGKAGYYSSGKSGGHGWQDIYKVFPGLVGMNTNVALLKGRITLNGVPVEAKIIVDAQTKNENYTTINSNSSSGKYLVNLYDGEKFKVTYKLDGQTDRVEMIDLTTLTGYIEKTIDVEFSATSPVDTTKKTGPVDLGLTDPNAGKAKTGNESISGLVFKVQIAAYRMPENYSYDKLKGLGKVEKMDLDGIMRFTIGGEFKTLNSANDHCAKVRAAGQTDAFVTAIYNGKRVYLEELEKAGIIPPQKR